ncbi:SDR family oxidoreductase [Amycolatopsis pigmentata]|uniref:SDR family oxidoreductase n=1 Tax=Amycolatopsis pigmentata TaxID=450801 RepID=A0ABW5FWC4_9PSEU
MTESILVTGATGTLGRVVAERLLAGGHRVNVLSRRSAPSGTPYRWHTGDLHTGAGVDAAVAGVNAIVHCATTMRRGGDEAATRRLVDAVRRSGSPRLVYISIVGIDRVPFRYYRAKLAAERLIEESGLPWTILRTTQFHDLIVAFSAVQRRLPVTFALRRVRFQPIDVREVADRLATLAVDEPAGRVADMGGPEVREEREFARLYLRAVGRRRPVVPVRLPGGLGRAYRDGAHLTPEHAVGTITFEEFLRSRYS